MIEYLTQRETAELLRVSSRTLRDWRRTGTGPPFSRVGTKLIRYLKADVDAWVAKTRQESP